MQRVAESRLAKNANRYTEQSRKELALPLSQWVDSHSMICRRSKSCRRCLKNSRTRSVSQQIVNFANKSFESCWST